MRRPALTLVLLMAVAAAAGADWLVTKDGARVETDGPWKVKGSIVVFTLPNGTLSSLRLSEVDLDQSAEATYEAENPPPETEEEEAEEPVEPVLVVTDKDIRRAPRSAAAGGGQPGSQESSTAGPTINEPFELLSWNQEPRGAGVEIRGTLVYRGEEPLVERLTMIVSLETADGVRFASTSAALTSPTLRPGAGTTFRAVFPEVRVEDYRISVEVESGQGRRP